MSMREWQLPMVALPLPEEAFGSWFERLGKRYRMGVDELARQLDVDIDFGVRCSRWIPAKACTATFAFCETCFFLNPFDVTEPYWRGLAAGGRRLLRHTRMRVRPSFCVCDINNT